MSLVRIKGVCDTLSGDLPCESCLATRHTSLVRSVCIRVYVSGHLQCESCKKGVCSCVTLSGDLI